MSILWLGAAAKVPETLVPKPGELWRMDGNLRPAVYLRFGNDAQVTVSAEGNSQATWRIVNNTMSVDVRDQSGVRLLLQFRAQGDRWRAERVGWLDASRYRSYAKHNRPAKNIYLLRAANEFLYADKLVGNLPGFGRISIQRNGPIRGWEAFASEPSGPVVEKESALIVVPGGYARTALEILGDRLVLAPFSREPESNYAKGTGWPYRKEPTRGLALQRQGDEWQLLPEGLFADRLELTQNTRLRLDREFTTPKPTTEEIALHEAVFRNKPSSDSRVGQMLDWGTKLCVGETSDGISGRIGNPSIWPETLEWVVDRIVSRADYAQETGHAYEILEKIVQHPRVTPAIVAKISAALPGLPRLHGRGGFYADCLLATMRSPYAPPEAEINFRRHMEQAISSDDGFGIGYIVHFRKPIPPDIVARLPTAKSEWIRVEVARQQNGFSDAFANLAADPSFRVRTALAGNSAISGDVQLRLAEDPDWDVIWALTCNSSLCPPAGPKLLADSVAQLESVLAKPEGPTSNFERERWTRVTAGLLRHARAVDPDERTVWLRRLARSSEASLRALAAENILTPPELLTALAQDSMWWIRKRVAENLKTPDVAVEFLIADPHPEVKAAAEQSLQVRKSILQSRKAGRQ